VPDEHLGVGVKLRGHALLHRLADLRVGEVASDLAERRRDEPAGEGHAEGGEPPELCQPVECAALPLTQRALLVIPVGVQVGKLGGGGALVGNVAPGGPAEPLGGELFGELTLGLAGQFHPVGAHRAGGEK